MGTTWLCSKSVWKSQGIFCSAAGTYGCEGGGTRVASKSAGSESSPALMSTTDQNHHNTKKKKIKFIL